MAQSSLSNQIERLFFFWIKKEKREVLSLYVKKIFVRLILYIFEKNGQEGSNKNSFRNLDIYQDLSGW